MLMQLIWLIWPSWRRRSYPVPSACHAKFADRIKRISALQVVKGFCDKADAKDKLTGLIQVRLGLL